jgi:tRNA-specific 2-thiouridylase
VAAIDGERGDVWVSAEPDDLLAGGLVATGVVWSGGAAPPAGNPFACEVQIRYCHRPVAAQVAPVGPDGADVRFQDAVSAVTPGQAAVFYRHDEVLGCGWIDRAVPLRVTGS